MSKVIAKQIDNILKSDKFLRHKQNKKGNTAIYSRNHPTAKFVRVVVDSGIDLTTGKGTNRAGVKLVYINRQKGWRVITTEIVTNAKGLASTIKAQETAEKFVKSCKFCKAKKFKAKTGNEVCANACWTAWAGKKKAASPKKKTSQKVARKSSKKIVAEILPGDLVTVEQITLQELTHDYTGSILGIVMNVDQFGKVNVNWTANTSNIHEWEMPFTNHYLDDCRQTHRFKVLSRPVEWVKVA